MLDLGDRAPFGEACFFPERLPFVRGFSIAQDVNGDGRIDVVGRDPEGFALYLGGLDGFALARRFEGEGHELFCQDLDGDGDLDLLFEGTDRYLLYFGDAGVFGPPVSIGITGTVRHVTAGDVDDDGLVDLAITHDMIEIWRRDPGGSFQSTALFPGAYALLLGDADADGIVDVLFPHQVPPGGVTLFIARGLGGGRFAEGMQLLDASGLLYAAGDFDGDGQRDLGYGDAGRVHVWLGLRTELSLAIDSHRVGAFDAEGDGVDELFVDVDLSDENHLVRLGDEGLQSIGSFTADHPSLIRFGDLDGDEAPDVVFSDRVDRYEVALLDRAGRFNPVQQLESYPFSRPAIARIDSDPHPDLLIGSTILTSISGEGTFRAALPAPTCPSIRCGASLSRSILGDLDADGRLDLISEAGIALGLGDGRFDAQLPIAISEHPLLADADRDGLLDLLYVEPSSDVTLTIRIERNLGSLQFAMFEPLRDEGGPVPTADVDHDGYLDLVVGDRLWFGSGGTRYLVDPLAPPVERSSTSLLIDLEKDGSDEVVAIRPRAVAVFSQREPGTFVQTATVPVSSAVSLAIHDDRLFVLAQDTSYSVYRIASDGLHPELENQATLDAEGRHLLVTDVSGDGRVDLLIASSHRFPPPSSLQSGLVQIFLGTDDGKFVLARTIGDSGAATSVEIADLNGDALPDIGIASEVLNTVGQYHVHLSTP